MSKRARMAMFFTAAPALAALFAWAIGGLPSFGRFHGAYARFIAHVAVNQRNATDVITAVNFDYRALDTLGEEFILFTSVAGLLVLLREKRGEQERSPSQARRESGFHGASFGLKGLAMVYIGPLLILSFYIDSHGALTPGGGFQGGVIGAAALLLVFLGGGYMAMRRVSPRPMVEFAEAAGAGGYALMGLGGMIFASAFFYNFLGMGTAGKLLSAGTIPINSLAVGLEVTGAFTLLWSEFLHQTLMVRGR